MQTATSDPGSNQPSTIPFLQTLQIIHVALGMGIIMFCCIVLYLVTNGTATSAGADPATARIMSWIHIGVAVSSYPMAVIAFTMTIHGVRRSIVKGGSIATAGAKLQAAYIVRLALFEGVAIVGLIAVLLSGQAVLQEQPAYWANLVSAAAFLLFLAMTFPTRGRVEALFGAG